MKITTPKEKRSIPLKNGEYYNLYQEHIELYKNLYANIDIEQEIRNIIGWNLANINKRKMLINISSLKEPKNMTQNRIFSMILEICTLRVLVDNQNNREEKTNKKREIAKKLLLS